jgi:lipid-binding SYLF domain-containing protein
MVPISAAIAQPAKTDPQADRAAMEALRRLVAGTPAARQVSEKAIAVLVFPRIVKAGFLLGGAYGEGVLLQGGKPVGYYNSASASYGLQAGAQAFSYALFFMNAAAMNYLNRSDGFEIGSGPSVVVVDQGSARKFSSTTLSQDVYAFIFGQKGLMAGMGIEGTKITKLG